MSTFLAVTLKTDRFQKAPFSNLCVFIGVFKMLRFQIYAFSLAFSKCYVFTAEHCERCSVWGCCGEILLNKLQKLQKLQNRAARIVTNSSYDASSLPLIGSLDWLTIKEMIEFETATTVYKSLHGLAPEYMRQMFTKSSENTSRSLRNTNTDLRIPRFATSYVQRSFSYRGVTVSPCGIN